MKHPLKQPAIILFLVVIIVFMLLSCSTYEAVGYCPEEKEYLTVPDKNDRIIIGYQQGWLFKNRFYYQVIDCDNKRQPRIFINDTILQPIGAGLICKY